MRPIRFARLATLTLTSLGAACSSTPGDGAVRATAPLSSSTLLCDVVIAGGTTAALGAALASARAGAQTCLLEPTDWPGGQLTAAGVPAIDFAWQNVPGYAMATYAKRPENLPPDLVAWLAKVGDPGHCSVSVNCFEPKNLLTQAIYPALSQVGSKLTVLKNTVVKRVDTAPVNGRTRITSISAIRRTATNAAAWGGYDVNLSVDMPDWYSPDDSARYTKERITINPRAGAMAVVDATDLGEVLVLSGAPYLQGTESVEGGTDTLDERCGQTVTFPFYMRYESSSVADDLPNVTPDHPEQYGYEHNYGWAEVWRYRRVLGSSTQAAVGDVSNQNWRLGNDYAHGSILRSKADAAGERGDWRGGIDYGQLDAAEREAYGWFRWFRNDMPGGQGGHLSLARDVAGTGHGLSKVPYLRDTRRSIGWNGFVLKQSDLQNDGSGLTGKRFIDRVAIGLYSADLHPMQTCRYPDFVYHDWTPYPYYVPLRALTNRDVANLLVAGKTMAQSFQVNAATRLHAIELASGIGAGAAAATMIAKSVFDTADLVPRYADVQAVAKRYTPVDWTIDGVQYPRAGERLESIGTLHLYCPPDTSPDLTLGYCVDADNAYGPFTRAMSVACDLGGGGPPCTATRAFAIDGHTVNIPRWSRSFAASLRGGGPCMAGAHLDATLPVCVEESSDSASGVKEAYGPFDAAVVKRCHDASGGDACYTNRWSYAFFASLQ